MIIKNKFAVFALGVALISSSVQAQNTLDEVKVTSKTLRGSVNAIHGAGGNIGVSAGKDGVLIIDDQYAPLAEKIASALGELGSDKPKYIVNTHFHGDHTGSNAFFREQKDATIFAHANVRIRLASGENVNPASLPVVTYESGIQFHFNDETIHVFHLPSAHTDGDSAVWFEQPDVLHAGDVFFNGLFPFIDLDGGGSVPGYIAAVETLLNKVDDDTIIIPGHGEIADKADLEAFLTMIKVTNTKVDALKASGMSEDDVVKTGLGEEWKSWDWNFISEERWIRTLYQS
ncbi:MBL fold metallo-hydrolase [Alteromonas sp. 5E99-2]|uniref:MBL fold metallo-hydrolase n=1 Tax=Alteromonas sp. 5E99-2 TaxID=2817683 RepID=UPI001A99E160|nr:MBL fold metallo-hydrolase [Alteromonas sp. 5E99-2]MBO1254528.1 MBL fold metallo-hydrolase [Alteromonas sp. 5E99-2]